jgi:hypothetical protein
MISNTSLLGKMVKVLAMHPAEQRHERLAFVGKTARVVAVHGMEYCMEGEILVEGCNSYVKEWEVLPAAEVESIRDRVFALANSFAGGETGHIAVALHQAANFLTRAKDQINRLPKS